MREILFRGKRLDNGEWAEGYLVASRKNTYPDGCEIITVEGINYDELDYYHPAFTSYEVDPATVGQYTGLTENGKKIFEGDIVLGRFEFGMKVPSLVVFRDGSFGLEWTHAGKNFFTAFTGFCNVTFEVIGNVFDNPELLNKEA